MTGGTITTSGEGANGAFAADDGSTVTLSGVTINATGNAAHGVMATKGGVVVLENVDNDHERPEFGGAGHGPRQWHDHRNGRHHPDHGIPVAGALFDRRDQRDRRQLWSRPAQKPRWSKARTASF